MSLQNQLMGSDLVEVLWRRFAQHVFLTDARRGRQHMEEEINLATAMVEGVSWNSSNRGRLWLSAGAPRRVSPRDR